MLDQIGYDEVARDRQARRAARRLALRRFIGGLLGGLALFAVVFALVLASRSLPAGQLDRYLPYTNDAEPTPSLHRWTGRAPSEFTEDRDTHVGLSKIDAPRVTAPDAGDDGAAEPEAAASANAD